MEWIQPRSETNEAIASAQTKSTHCPIFPVPITPTFLPWICHKMIDDVRYYILQAFWYNNSSLLTSIPSSPESRVKFAILTRVLAE
jgi:hypothetical protein